VLLPRPLRDLRDGHPRGGIASNGLLCRPSQSREGLAGEAIGKHGPDRPPVHPTAMPMGSPVGRLMRLRGRDEGSRETIIGRGRSREGGGVPGTWAKWGEPACPPGLRGAFCHTEGINLVDQKGEASFAGATAAARMALARRLIAALQEPPRALAPAPPPTIVAGEGRLLDAVDLPRRDGTGEGG